MELFDNLEKSFIDHSNRHAFMIGQCYYTYHQFSQKIANIREAIKTTCEPKEKNLGLIANDDIETYAGIVACWFEGKAYVPLNPLMPRERNASVIEQADITTIIDSSKEAHFPSQKVILSATLNDTAQRNPAKDVSPDEIAYIFFTSGTTGVPKGVPIMFSNLIGFAEAMFALDYYEITEADRFLQMFELTFDLSVMSYMIPMLKGACTYTIPKDKVKYSYIYELMEDHELTVMLMVPSILQYLRPYFDEINCPKMRYSLFCGEALPLDVTSEWSKCIPNARVINVYGPTEDTIYCTDYEYKRDKPNKSHNGVLSIGKSMKGNYTIIVDDKNKILPAGEKGELCLGGVQLTPGYWKNPTKNEEVFFYIDYNGESTRFYRTGDLCVRDKEGDLLYLGRIDFQTKIQGFRVELSEIEFRAKEFLNKKNVVAVAYKNKMTNAEIGMVIESEAFEVEDLRDYLSQKLPSYMLPSEIKFQTTFPLNTNGKTDRKKLTKLFEPT